MGQSIITTIYILLNALFEDDEIPNKFIILEFTKMAEFLLSKTEGLDPQL